MKDILSASGLMILAAYVYVASNEIVSKTNMDIGPDFMPKVAAILIFCLSAIMLVGAIRTQKTARQDESSAAPAVEDGRSKLARFLDNYSDWLSIVIIILYGLAFSSLGFVLSTSLYIFVQGLLLSRSGQRRLVAIAVTAVAVPLISNFVFVHLMHVFLPAGILE